jgi:hypothetical protein
LRKSFRCAVPAFIVRALNEEALEDGHREACVNLLVLEIKTHLVSGVEGNRQAPAADMSGELTLRCP